MILLIASRDTVREIPFCPGMHSRGRDGADLPATRLQRGPCHFFRRLGDDIHDPVERIKAVERRHRPLDHLDLLDLRQSHRQAFPEDKPLGIDIDGAAVDQQEHLVGEQLLVAAHTDVEVRSGPCMTSRPGMRRKMVGTSGAPD